MLASVVLAGVLCAGAAQAFTHHLSTEQVDEAYDIGRNPDKRESFFEKYIHYVKVPQTGPDVHLIEFRTPYELVARQSQEHWANYHMLDSEREYATHPDEVIVRVLLCGTNTFSFAIPPQDPAHAEDYLHGFEFRVSQTSLIAYKKLTLLDAGCANFEGAEALLHFDADQFAPGDVKIEVVAPGGQTYSTTFDLDQLK